MCCRQPCRLVRTTVQKIDDNNVLCEGYFGTLPAKEHELATTIQGAIRLLPPSLKQMLENSRWCDDGFGLASAIENNTAICVVDGSFHPEYGFGTAAWVFDNGLDEIQATGCSRAVGEVKFMCSYRAELFGIYLALQTTLLICKQFDIIDGGIEIGCDNTEAIRKGLAELYFPSIQHKHFDLLWAIHSLRQKISISISFRHVRGHQDRHANVPLDRWAVLNIHADNEAKWYLSQVIQNPKLDADLTLISPHWNVAIEGNTITGDVVNRITDYITSAAMKFF